MARRKTKRVLKDFELLEMENFNLKQKLLNMELNIIRKELENTILKQELHTTKIEIKKSNINLKMSEIDTKLKNIKLKNKDYLETLRKKYKIKNETFGFNPDSGEIIED